MEAILLDLAAVGRSRVREILTSYDTLMCSMAAVSDFTLSILYVCLVW